MEAVSPEAPALVAGDRDAAAARVLEEETEGAVDRWCRRLVPGTVVSPWPPEGPWRTVALRLPRSKDELEMLVHAAASILAPGGELLVYGANDEGARSAPARIEPVFGEVATVAIKRRCRVLRAVRPRELPELRGSLDQWRIEWTLEVDGRRLPWVSYPGLFAHGRLDAGTALLLEAMAAPSGRARVLDYGCGTGVLGGALRSRNPDLEVDLLDADALALEAAGENVTGARRVLGDRLDAVGGARYDRIVSNPPYHEGKAESLVVVERLVRQAPRHLTGAGVLEIVVQRRLPVDGPLREAFAEAEVVAETGTHRVWRARA